MGKWDREMREVSALMVPTPKIKISCGRRLAVDGEGLQTSGFASDGGVE